MEVPMFYNEQEEWARALLLYDSVLKEINTKLEILNNEFKMTHQYNPIEHITSRIKSSQSIAKKIRHQGRELNVENIVKYINDVAGIRIICSFTSDIYRISDLITQQSDVKVLKIKDYIMNPKPNGYMSYHMIVSVPIFLSGEVIETKAEIQIRTIAMDFWASLEHKMYYKFEGNAPQHIRKELKECADIVAYLDQRMLSINEQIKNYKREFGQEIAYISETSEALKVSYGTVVDDEEEEIISYAAEHANSERKMNLNLNLAESLDLEKETISEVKTISGAETISETETISKAKTVSETETVLKGKMLSKSETISKPETNLETDKDMLSVLQEKAIRESIRLEEQKEQKESFTKSKKKKQKDDQTKAQSGKSWFQTSFFGWDKKKQESAKNA